MSIKYCLPIIEPRKAMVLKVIGDNVSEYHYFEVWLDYLEDLDDAFIQKLAVQLNSRLILLFRRQNLEDIHMSLERRLAILDMLQDSAVLIDLDISTQLHELNHVLREDHTLHIIASYHNYLETPDSKQLKRIIATMSQYKPYIYKLATHCKDEHSALRLLQQLLAMKDSNFRTVVLGMGEYGKITRLIGTLWGNEITFAPRTSRNLSAPGQLTRTEYEVLLKELE